MVAINRKPHARTVTRPQRNDIELLAGKDTPTGRRVFVNGAPTLEGRRNDPSRIPIASITQHTTFLPELQVEEFLSTHARIRAAPNTQI